MERKPGQKMTLREKLRVAFWILFVLAMTALVMLKVYYLINLGVVPISEIS